METKVYKIAYDQNYGRHLVATSDILPGQCFLNEPAIIVGPSPSTNDPVCPICYKRDKCTIYQCPDCQLPLCTDSCASDTFHKLNECKILSKIGFEFVKESYKELYQFINAIRAVRMKDEDNLLKWKQLEQLQDNVGYLESIQSFEIFDVAVCKAGIDLTLARHCLGVLKTNSFSELSPSKAIEKLYFFSSLMSHSCIMNTQRQFEQNSSYVHVIATRFIPAGEPITNTYVPFLNNTYERQTEMKTSWNFSCQCPRCKDPTENGTMLGAVHCSNCNQITLCPSSDSVVGLNWKCINLNCGKVPTEYDFINRLESIQRSIPSNSIDMDNWYQLNKTQDFLHPNHSIFTQIKYHLSQTIGKDGIQDLETDMLIKKATYCTEVLGILEKLYGDGVYMFIGVIYFERWSAERELLHRIDMDKGMDMELDVSGLPRISTAAVLSNAEKAFKLLKPAIPGSNELKMKVLLEELYKFTCT